MSHTAPTAEEEIVLLRGAWELIGEMVNFAMLDLRGTDPDSEIRFHTHIHQRYFNVLLVDFLSRTDRKVPVQQISFLGALRSISADPNFERNGSAAELKQSSEEFSTWLREKVGVDTWIPSLGKEVHLVPSRMEFLKLAGNVTKHSFLRSAGFAEELQSLLKGAGHSITLEQALVALGDFYERFHTDILNYLGSTLAEYLNNLRWAIYEYLRPECEASLKIRSGRFPAWEFTVPTSIRTDFAISCYWDLMNAVRTKPYMRKFQVTRYLKKRY